MNKEMYENAVEYLLKIPLFTKKNSFEDTKAFLKQLGNYQQMEHVIHVAGTNGKGSVCNFIQTVLIEAGYSVGMFTSPHLICINERIRFDGEAVSNEAFVHAFLEVKACVDELERMGRPHPAFFEFIFGMACVLFKERKPDYIILETGLGGRLDATNIIEKPILTVITSIALDHTEYLGDSILQIAAEKAGIIKPGAPLIYDASSPEACQAIEEYATKFQVKSYPVSEKKTEIKKFTNKYIDFLYQCGYDRNICIKLPSGALYQVMNAAVAISSIQQLNSRISDSVIKRGIERAKWHGRMEWTAPYFLMDGAHNVAGIEKSAVSVAKMNKKVILLFSAVKEKNCADMIRMLCEKLSFLEVIVTQLSIARAANAEELWNLFDKILKNNKSGKTMNAPERLYIEKDVQKAMHMALRHRDYYEDLDVIIFVTGSLFLVGEVGLFLGQTENYLN